MTYCYQGKDQTWRHLGIDPFDAVEIDDQDPFDERFQKQDIERDKNHNSCPGPSFLWQYRAVHHRAGFGAEHETTTALRAGKTV